MATRMLQPLHLAQATLMGNLHYESVQRLSYTLEVVVASTAF